LSKFKKCTFALLKSRSIQLQKRRGRDPKMSKCPKCVL